MPSAVRRAFRRGLVVVVVLVGIAAIARAVTISPTLVVLDPRRRVAEVALFNSGAVPEELSLKVRYGTWVADSTGHAEVVLSDTMPGGARAGWITVYPSRIVVPPGGRQTVRVLARPPAGLDDGEYSFRLLVSSQPTELAGPVRPDSALQTRLLMQITQSIPVFFRVGTPTVRLEFASARATVTGDSAVVDIGVRHAGTASWVGTATISLLGVDGGTLGEQRLPITIARSERRRIVLPMRGPALMVASVRVRMTTQRDDLARDDLLAAPPLDTLLPPERP